MAQFETHSFYVVSKPLGFGVGTGGGDRVGTGGWGLGELGWDLGRGLCSNIQLNLLISNIRLPVSHPTHPPFGRKLLPSQQVRLDLH